MFSSNTSQVQGAGADPQFNYVTMLLHGDGTNGAQNNTFTDSSTNNFTITRNGNTTQGTFSPYGSNWSNFFDGSGDYLAVADNAAFDLPGDFTIEFWINPVATTGAPFALGDYRSANNGMSLYFSSNKLNLYVNSADVLTGASNLSVGAWTHVALVRSGSGSNNLKLYLNGVQDAQATNTTSYTGVAGNGVSIAADYGGSFSTFFNGYISNVRIVKSAVYTGNFTPSTAPLTAITNTSLLTCQSNRFRDASSNNFAITVNGNPSVQRFSPFAPTAAYSAATIGGSGYFDGSGDYLTTATGSALSMGTGDFTWEGWIYFSSTSGYRQIFSSRASTGLGGSLAVNPSNGLTWYTTGFVVDYTTSIGTNQWIHVAVTRSGSTLRVYANGVQVGSASNSQDMTTDQIAIGSNIPGGEFFSGYISNVRIIKGTALYTGSTLTVPTAPLTAISGTSLLCNFTNAGIIDNAMMNDLETVGNAQISTSVKKFGTGSLLFNATSANTNYLATPATSLCNFGTGAFTIEFWLYPDTTNTSYAGGNNATILDTDSPSGTGTDWWVVHQVNSTIIFASNSAVVLQSSASLAATTWQHVAIVRNGSTITIYIDGTSAGSVTYSTTIGGNRRLFIATQPGQSRWFKGYIDDLRITNGVARYTANFTPPTAAFPNN